MDLTSLTLSVWASGFLAATLLPGGSEVAFIWTLAQVQGLVDLLPGESANYWSYWLLVNISLANTLGALVTFAMGYFGIRLLPSLSADEPTGKTVPNIPQLHNSRNAAPVSESKPKRYIVVATGWFKRFGIWTLLLSWLPLVGDFLCLAAGAARLPVFASVVLIFFGKLVRYLILLWGYMGVFA